MKFKRNTVRVPLRVLQNPINKKGHCLEFFVTTVKRENSLEQFLQVFFKISFTAKSEGAVLECLSRKHTVSSPLFYGSGYSINVEISPSSSSALIWFSSWPVFLCLQHLQVIPQNDYHRKVRLVLVHRHQRAKDSSCQPFWLCVRKNHKALPKAGQTGFLQGIMESLVGNYHPISARFCDLMVSLSHSHIIIGAGSSSTKGVWPSH